MYKHVWRPKEPRPTRRPFKSNIWGPLDGMGAAVFVALVLWTLYMLPTILDIFVALVR